jgi:hypothetical protein
MRHRVKMRLHVGHSIMTRKNDTTEMPIMRTQAHTAACERARNGPRDDA